MAEWQPTERISVDAQHELQLLERPTVGGGRGILSSIGQDVEIRAAVYRKGDENPRPLFTVTTKRGVQSKIVGVRDVQFEALRRLGAADWTNGNDYTF